MASDKRFPHLSKANGWPGLATVDPFDLQVTFNPYLWTPDVEIHLVSTRVDSTYQHVVGWESEAERDAWYDAHSEQEFRLDSEFHVLPGEQIKLPIAFEVLQHYNQAFVDFPPTPTADGSKQRTRFYYFIEDVQYRSPSATACRVTIDEWTTHMPSVSMPYIRLERGHAPLAAVDVDDYLANPMDNSELLGIADDSFGVTERLKSESLVMIDDPDVWAVLALSASIWEDPGAIGTTEWHTPYSHGLMTQGAPCIQTVAVEPSDLPTLLANIETIAPQMMPTIQACYIIPKKWVDLGYGREAYGVNVREIGATARLQNLISLNRAMFGYPDEYADLAKLYTSPYANLELVDQSGAVQQVRIEDTTGRLQVSVAAALTWPALGIDVAVIGIGASGTGTLSWSTFDSHTATTGGMWTSTLRHYAIPSFLVTADPKRMYAYQQYYAIQQADSNNAAAAEMAYRAHQATYDMTIAGLDRQLARLSQQQANDTDQLAISQAADNSTLTAQKKKLDDDQAADASFAQAALDTSLSAIAMAQSQAVASNAQAIEGAVQAQAVATTNAEAIQAQVDYSQQQADAQYKTSITSMAEPVFRQYVEAGAQAQAASMGGNQRMAELLMGNYDQAVGQAEATTSVLLDKIGGALNAATGGLTAPLFSAGGLLSSMTTAEHRAITSGNQAQLATANGSVQQAALSLNGALLTAQQMNASYSLTAGNSAAATAQAQALSLSKIANAKTLATTQNGITHDMQDASLARQQSAQTAITGADVALGKTNAGITKGIADDTTTMNKRLQDESILRGYQAAKLSGPQTITSPAYSTAMATRPQFLAARVVTQSPAAIAAAGDRFLMYGYRLAGRQWRVTSLNVMTQFSYWRGDPMFGDAPLNEISKRTLRAIFAAGVTVWRDPMAIGSTSIYDNRRR